jgi:hypothetical protein
MYCVTCFTFLAYTPFLICFVGYIIPHTIGKNLFVDLGAERLIAADRGTEKIAVEIKRSHRLV